MTDDWFIIFFHHDVIRPLILQSLVINLMMINVYTLTFVYWKDYCSGVHAIAREQ